MVYWRQVDYGDFLTDLFVSMIEVSSFIVPTEYILFQCVCEKLRLSLRSE